MARAVIVVALVVGALAACGGKSATPFSTTATTSEAITTTTAETSTTAGDLTSVAALLMLCITERHTLVAWHKRSPFDSTTQRSGR